MIKKMMMPVSFVLKAYYFVFLLLDCDLEPRAREVCNSLESLLGGKIDTLYRRELFCRYKSAHPGSIERESFRREYIDKAGIHPDWRSLFETNACFLGLPRSH